MRWLGFCRIAATGRVQPEAVERAAQVVRRFRDLAARVDVDEGIPVATAAFREAANRPELASVIQDAIGTPIRVLLFDLPMTHYGHIEKPRQLAGGLVAALTWLTQ